MGNLNCKQGSGKSVVIVDATSTTPPKPNNNNDNGRIKATSSSAPTSIMQEDNSRTSANNQSSINGTSTTTISIEESTVPSSIKNDDFEIPIKIFTPPSSSSSNNNNKIRAAVLFIHGGIFAQGDMNSHPTISHALASKLNLTVVTASFRNGHVAPHETNITYRDLQDVIQFIQKRFIIGEEDVPFGLVGSSSGGFFALTLCQTLGNSIPISFCIPICPVANPFKRASYLRSSISGSAKSEGYTSFHDPQRSSFILEKQLSFWKNDNSMKEAGESLKENRHNIPTLLIIGSADKNVPFSVTADVQSWATRTIVIGGRGHELCDEVVKGGGYHCYLSDIDRFLEYCLSSL